ncbi:MAG: permease-like cell division protein FtsX [Bacteroidales bacterium]
MTKQEEKFARRRLRNSYISTSISITLVLYMLGLTGAIILFAREISIRVRENYSFTIYMHEETPQTDILRFQKYLDTRDAVKSTRFISSEEASQDYARDIGEDFIEIIGKSPIPDQIELRVKSEYANLDSLKGLEADIAGRSIVADFHYNRGLIDKVNENMKKFGVMLSGFGILLFIIAFALINNTIRLAVFANRFIIRSMQMVGATQGFIRKPFLIRGVFQGLISGVLSILLLSGTFMLVNKEVDNLITLAHLDLLLVLFAFVLLLGVMIAWVSTWFAVWRYLRLKTDLLYQY